MNIEDDLSASPVRLRQEIRRLRAMLPHELTGMVAEWPFEQAGALAHAAGSFLCPILSHMPGAACACPGACHRNAEEVISNLEKNGFTIVRLKK